MSNAEEILLTPRVKKVIKLAIDEARNLHHNYIGTEHLLLGLVQDGEGIAAGVLQSLGANLDKVRTQTVTMLSRSSTVAEPPTAHALPSVPQEATAFVAEKDSALLDRFDKLTEQARKVLSYAHEEAQSYQHKYVGTEHLLLGLMREGEGIAAKVLYNLGMELDKVRKAVESILGIGGMDNQSKEGTSGSFGPDPDTYQAAGKLLAAEKSKWLYGSLLLRLITSPTHVFDIVSRFSEYIEAEIPYLPPDEHTELLQMLFILGTAELIILRGVRFGWKYQAIEELRANLTQGLNGFFRAYIEVREVTNQPPDELPSTFMAEMQHGGKYLEQFINRYRELTERQQGPFAGCAHCPAKCLYRPEVQLLLMQKNREWISEELTSQSHNTEMDRYSSVARAATNIVQSWLDDAGSTAIEKSVAGVAYCATLHTIASSNSYTAYEQALLGDNLHKHFF